jgi:hypothetical protein
MPRVAKGWRTQCAPFARAGFTEALQSEAAERGAALVSLKQLEETLRVV